MNTTITYNQAFEGQTIEMENELLYSFGDSVENFLKFSVICCGVNEGTYNFLKAIVSTQADLDRFIEQYDGDFDNLDRTAYKMIA